MLEDLFGAVMYGLVGLHTQQPPCTNRPSATPRAHPVAALPPASGAVDVNPHHQMLELDALSREVLRLSSGERRRDEMLALLAERVTADRVNVHGDGGTDAIGGGGAGRSALGDRLDQALVTLTRNALFVA